ncbi:MAG: hypothetical protein AAF235_03490 [Planctomycetota bacterium]
MQDAMSHLFSAEKRRPTPLDFVAGHIYADSPVCSGYAPQAVLEAPVCASSAKFHDAPVSTDQQQRFGVDIAYVSHQSETADLLVDKFERSTSFPKPSLLLACRARIESIIKAWEHEAGIDALLDLPAWLARELARPNDEHLRSTLKHQFVMPLAERIIRHQTLTWAAEIADSEGLTLGLFGRGWEDHPTLARFARGPIEHGDALRACYQAAAVHLHASVQGASHQRVFECAMSGGVPLSRRSWAEFYTDDWARTKDFIERRLPTDVLLWRSRSPAYQPADHPELMQMYRRRSRMPRPAYGWDHEWLNGRGIYAWVENDPNACPWNAPMPPEASRPLTLFGDPFELTFSTRDELRDRILHASDRGEWRRQITTGVSRRVRDRVSSNAFATNMLDMVVARLGERPVARQPSSQTAETTASPSTHANNRTPGAAA